MKKILGLLVIAGGIFAATYNWKKRGYINTIKKNPYGLITNYSYLEKITEQELFKMSVISKKMETDTASKEEITFYSSLIKKYQL